ncbi:hypothetical protein N7G274_008353 [Stereocaulon virgatum]|uniref:Uncharacterized protein n=1 Tax=Stereocaulon virgatum TaxID=373712 RepID=A0ABR4A0L9_9LECA
MSFSALARGLSLRKIKDSDKQHAQFPSAPDRHGFDIKKSWIVSGRQPGRHSALQPHQLSALIRVLSLPSTTELLATRIAALGPPLTRPSFTNAPNCLCQVHTWFELRYIEELTDLIGEEMGPRLAKLRTCPRELVSPQTEQLLLALEPYLYLFPTAGAEAGHSTDGAACHRQCCAFCNTTSCMACKLSLLLQNSEALRAVKNSVFGRKKRHGAWPDLCGWLDPEPGPGWERKWMQHGHFMLKDRIRVRQWGKDRREAKRRDEPVSEYAVANANAEDEEFDEIMPEDDVESDNERTGVRQAKTWAESYHNLVGERPQTEWYNSSLNVSPSRQSCGATEGMDDSQYWENVSQRGRSRTEERPQTEWYDSSAKSCVGDDKQEGNGAHERQATRSRGSDGAISALSGWEFWEDEIPGESYPATQPQNSFGATEIISMYGHMGDHGPGGTRQTRTSSAYGRLGHVNPRESRQTRMSRFMR